MYKFGKIFYHCLIWRKKGFNLIYYTIHLPNQAILSLKKLQKGSKTPKAPFMEILNSSHKITRYIIKYVFGIIKKYLLLSEISPEVISCQQSSRRRGTPQLKPCYEKIPLIEGVIKLVCVNIFSTINTFSYRAYLHL